MSRVDLKLLGACALLVTLGGCDATRRSDFIVDHIGDAVAANKAIHTSDPWPRESFDTRIRHEGVRGAAAVSNYRNNGGGASASQAKPAGGAPSVATQ